MTTAEFRAEYMRLSEQRCDAVAACVEADSLLNDATTLAANYGVAAAKADHESTVRKIDALVARYRIARSVWGLRARLHAR